MKSVTNKLFEFLAIASDYNPCRNWNHFIYGPDKEILSGPDGVSSRSAWKGPYVTSLRRSVSGNLPCALEINKEERKGGGGLLL